MTGGEFHSGGFLIKPYNLSQKSRLVWKPEGWEGSGYHSLDTGYLEFMTFTSLKKFKIGDVSVPAYIISGGLTDNVGELI